MARDAIGGSNSPTIEIKFISFFIFFLFFQKYPGYFVKTRKWAKKALQVRLFNLLIISYLFFYPTAYVTSEAQITPVHNIDFQAVTPLFAAL